MNEQFTVTLSNPSTSTVLDTDTATGIIVTDDGPVFAPSSAPAPLGLTPAGLESRVTLGDLDGDGDLDALAGDATGEMRFFENTGSAFTPEYVPVGGSSPLGLPDTGSFSAPALGDLDGDGDLDLLVGLNSGRFKYYENTGDGSSAAFVRVGGNAPFGYPTPEICRPRRWWTLMRMGTWTCSWATSTGGCGTSRTSGMWTVRCSLRKAEHPVRVD